MIALLFAVIVGFGVHESGHLLAARALGYPARVRLMWLGPAVEWGSDDRVSPPRDRIAVALAGPLAAVAFGGALWASGQPSGLFVLLSLGVAQLLLPASDGARIIRELRGRFFADGRAGRH